MATVTNDIVTRFAFEGNINPLTDFNANLGSGITYMAAFGAAIAASGAAVANWATDISSANDATGQLSRTIGVSVEALGELGYAASVSGSDAQSMETSLASLSQKIGEASIQGSEDFARIGLSIRDASGQLKSADRVFLEFADRVKQLGLSQQQTQDFASRLGIDDSLVQLLRKSSVEINELRSRAVELGRVTTAQSDSMLAYNDTISTMNYAYENLKVQIAVGLIPQLQELAKGMTTWLVDSADDIVAGFKKIVHFTLIMGQSLKRMSPVIMGIAGAFVAWKLATIGLTGALRVFGKLGIIAVLTGLYVVVDDIMTAFSGGKSVIADWYSELTGGRSMIDDIKKAASALGDAFMWLKDNVLMPVIDTFKLMWEYVGKVGQTMSEYGSSIAGFFGLGGDEEPKQPKQHEPAAYVPQAFKPDAMMGSVTNNSNRNMSVNNNTQIEIRTNDPERAGREVSTQIQRQTEDAYIQSGVSYR